MNKKIGWGSLSIILLIFAILFSIQLGRTFCLGDILLESVGLKGWLIFENSTLNIKVFISEFLLIAGFIIGMVFKNDRFAKAGRMLCLAFAILLGISLAYICLAMASFTRH